MWSFTADKLVVWELKWQSHKSPAHGHELTVAAGGSIVEYKFIVFSDDVNWFDFF